MVGACDWCLASKKITSVGAYLLYKKNSKIIYSTQTWGKKQCNNVTVKVFSK